MKYLFIFILFLSNFAIAQNSQDTVCMSIDRVGRIADTIAYLRNVKNYSVACDSALQDCKKWGQSLELRNIELARQRDDMTTAGGMLATQLGQQKAISAQWETKAMEFDKKLQKQKKTKRAMFGIFGGLILGMGGALVTSIILLK